MRLAPQILILTHSLLHGSGIQANKKLNSIVFLPIQLSKIHNDTMSGWVWMMWERMLGNVDLSSSPFLFWDFGFSLNGDKGEELKNTRECQKESGY